jgi:uncharacterized protein VirK/YbjX
MSMALHGAPIDEIDSDPPTDTCPPRLTDSAPLTNTWSILRLWSIFWQGLNHFGTHREVLSLLLSFPPYAEIVLAKPSFSVKYLTPHYLARGLTATERASCFLHHYRRLRAILPVDLLKRILKEDVVIHEIRVGDNRLTLTMGLSMPYDEEGELSLLLNVNDDGVFVLAFTIVPGCVVQSQAAEVLLITRLQGRKGASSQIGYATKAMQDVAPRALLLAALQGIAEAFGISEIAAIPAIRQTSYVKHCAASFKEAYDDFFVDLGIPKSDTGFYHASLPIQAKPLAFIKPGHKIRTKKKRAFKQQIQSTFASFFEQDAHGLPPESPPQDVST